MTGLESQQKLFEYFSKKDSLYYGDIEKLGPKGVPNAEKMAAYLSALSDLTKLEILFETDISDSLEPKKIWVLKKPLTLYQQSVVINGESAFTIASIINEFAKTANSKELLSNPLQIQEKDILALIELIRIYSENMDKETVDDKKELN